VARRRLAALAIVLSSVIVGGCSSMPSGAAPRGTTLPTGWHNGTCSRDCPFEVGPSSSTPTPQSAVRTGCQHLQQLKHEVSEALDSSDAAARLKSITSGAAWKAVSVIELAAGLSGKYRQLVVDGAVLNTAYAAAIRGGPLSPLKDALSKLSTDCQKEG
jgi:hypothetical protein